VLPAPKADFTVSDTVGCSPLSILLNDNSLNHDPTRNVWQVAGEFYESENAEVTLIKPGSYAVSLSIYNQLNCSNQLTQQKRVVVYPKPVALFDVFPTGRQTDEELFLIRRGTGASYYYWDIGDGNFIYTDKDTLRFIYEDSGHYTVTHIAVNDQGCSDTISQEMQVHLSPFCAIPNAFTGNEDRLNEQFAPQCSGISGYTMTIMNRWGEIMLTCENCSWDGTYQGVPAQGGVYFYRIDITTAMGERIYLTGPISLIR
jgi:gliding motility-associated-like protein